MASGEDIPYQLRPNKFIDRQIFIELLSKIVPHKNDGKYVYISMGGKHLVDHEAVYRRVGIKNLFSFDMNPTVVARQNCNRPHAKVICEEMLSGSLAGEIDEILKKFKPADQIVAWLDYTGGSKLQQLGELGEVLKKCQAGDVVRITINADDRNLKKDWIKAGVQGPGQFRAQCLKDKLGEYYPVEVVEVPDNGIPKVLGLAISLVVSAVDLEVGSTVSFKPVLITSYADGQRMFTATLLAVEPNGELPIGLKGWEFMPNAWDDVVEISAPDLSVREKMAIDKHLSKTPKSIIKLIKFQPASELDDAEHAVASYKRLHRFYPTFYAIGVQ